MSRSTLAELRQAVERAASLALPIGHFTIATTAWRSKALKRAVFELNLENRAADIFTVDCCAGKISRSCSMNIPTS